MFTVLFSLAQSKNEKKAQALPKLTSRFHDFCIDIHSFEGDQASFSHQRSLSADSDINVIKSSRDDQGNICIVSSRKIIKHNSTKTNINLISFRNHNTLVNKNIVETQF